MTQRVSKFRRNSNNLKVSQLLDMMLKNRLQTQLNKEKIEVLEYHSL